MSNLEETRLAVDSHPFSNAAVKIRPNVIFQQLQRDAVLLDITGDWYYMLNHVAAYIWQMLRDGVEAPQIVRAVAVRYEIDEATAAIDLVELLAELRQADLIAYDTDGA